MLSSELADLAGVTVRTLRHYHQIGLLPEPPRSTAGYRRYDIGHLVRLLRITRLTSLGVPLSALAEVLDDPSAGEELLDALDREAAAEIARLTARRDSIALLRRIGGPPDLPPELAAWRSAPEVEVPADMARYEHEQLVLLAHLLGEQGSADLTGLLEALADGGTVSAALTERFYALDADSPEHEVEALIEDWIAYVRPALTQLDGLPVPALRTPALLDQLSRRGLRPVQHRALRTLQQRLEHPDG